MAHELAIKSNPYFSTGTIYRAVCSCGRYRSGKHTRALDARRAWEMHKAAMTRKGEHWT